MKRWESLNTVSILTFRYASEKTLLMSADQLLTFLQQEQGMSSIDVTEATTFIKEFELSDLKDKGYMTQDGENRVCVCVEFVASLYCWMESHELQYSMLSFFFSSVSSLYQFTNFFSPFLQVSTTCCCQICLMCSTAVTRMPSTRTWTVHFLTTSSPPPITREYQIHIGMLQVEKRELW